MLFGFIAILVIVVIAVAIYFAINSKINEIKDKRAEKLAKKENSKTATIIKKEVKRPFMKFLATTTKSIALLLIAIWAFFTILFWSDVIDRQNELQEAAKEVTDEEWENYENYLNENGEKLSSSEKKEIEEEVKSYKKYLLSDVIGAEETYYGYESYKDWNKRILFFIYGKI